MLHWVLLAAALHAADKPAFTIVAPDAYAASLMGYVQRRSKVFDVKLAGLGAVLATHEGVDDAEKLKRFLYDEWKKRKVKFVLLVGDADVMPIRYMCLDRVTPAAFDYAFYPSDLYYADVAKADGSFDDWNGNKEGFHAGYFGEVRGEKNKNDPINYDRISYLPELALGRWPVSSPKEVEIVVNKTLAREKELANGAAAKSALMCCVPGWVDARRRMDRWSKDLAGWSAEKHYEGTSTPPTTANLVKTLNEGVGLVFHVGHGESWGWDRSIHLRDLKNVKNDKALPIVLSAGCSTAYHATLPPYQGYVDVKGVEHQGTDKGQVFKEPPPPPKCYQSGKYNQPSMGEVLVRGGSTGAVAYIGCNTGGQPCGITILEGFVKAVARKPDQRLGEAWRDALHYYHKTERLDQLKPTADWYPPSIYFQGMKYMLIGDPTTGVGT
jgi:hypothetical protein